MKSPLILTISLKTSRWWMMGGGLGSAMERGAYFLPTMLKRYNQHYLVITCDSTVFPQIQNLMGLWFHCYILLRAWEAVFFFLHFCLVVY